MKTEASWRITVQTNNLGVNCQKNKVLMSRNQKNWLVSCNLWVRNLQYEKWLQRPIETKQTVKTAAERKRKKSL